MQISGQISTAFGFASRQLATWTPCWSPWKWAGPSDTWHLNPVRSKSDLYWKKFKGFYIVLCYCQILACAQSPQNDSLCRLCSFRNQLWCRQGFHFKTLRDIKRIYKALKGKEVLKGSQSHWVQSHESCVKTKLKAWKAPFTLLDALESLIVSLCLWYDTFALKLLLTPVCVSTRTLLDVQHNLRRRHFPGCFGTFYCHLFTSVRYNTNINLKLRDL